MTGRQSCECARLLGHVKCTGIVTRNGNTKSQESLGAKTVARTQLPGYATGAHVMTKITTKNPKPTSLERVILSD
jgi:hypothetical protein